MTDAAVVHYLDEVNALCDELERKVVAMNGGKFDIPLKEFLDELDEHIRLRADFDRQLAHIAVPPRAQNKAHALDVYIRFANDLDAKRLTAARQGRAAYEREIHDEMTTAVNDPRIAARNAAGFDESCNAR